MSDGGYVLTEIWKPRDSWRGLPVEERRRFVEEDVGAFLGEMIGAGAEVLACALNDNSGPERIDYDYMAVWKVPDKAFAERIEEGARKIGFLTYFEQVNFSGASIPPPVLNEALISLDS